jgi:hypothetical protein
MPLKPHHWRQCPVCEKFGFCLCFRGVTHLSEWPLHAYCDGISTARGRLHMHLSATARRGALMRARMYMRWRTWARTSAHALGPIREDAWESPQDGLEVAF